MSPARLALLALVFLPSAPRAEQADPPQTPTHPTREQIARWIEQLGSDDFKSRSSAWPGSCWMSAFSSNLQRPISIKISSRPVPLLFGVDGDD